MPEQRTAADFVIRQKSVAVFSQQRTGKTYITMAVLEKLKWPFALIVAPLTSVDVVWVPALKQSDYVICRTLEEVAETLKSRKLTRYHYPAVLVMHYQLFVKHAKKLAKLPWQVVIIDESQGLKARNSQQSKAARRFRDMPRRIALSGTPIDDSEIDVWAQMRFVNHNILGETWGQFSSEFCYQGGYMNHEWKFDPAKKPRFLKRLKPHIYRLTVGFMNLKPIEFHPMPFHLLGEQDRLYQQMKSTGVIKTDNILITAPLAITQKIKLEQITGGYVLDDDNVAHFTGKAKERKLRWLVNRLKPPIVVFCQFRHEMPIIEGVLRGFFSRVKQLHGDITGDDRTNLIRDFQKNKVDALVCQLRTGGVAIDLTQSSELIFYSINHSYIDFEQVLFRLYGMNQKKVLHAYFPYAADTVDEEKMKVIENKKSAAYKIVSHFEPGE